MVFLLITFFKALERVSIGTAQHLAPIGIAIVFCFVLFRLANLKFNQKQKETTLKVIGTSVSLTIIIFHTYYISHGEYDFSQDLPLFLCSFLALIVPVFTHYRKYWMYEILLFWIVAATSQGVITPDIAEGFPSFDYFRYWIVHLGLLTIIFYATLVLKMRPKFKSMFKSFFALQIYAAILMGINYILDANYSYLNRKPESASALDYLGDWPYYILVMEVLLIPFFLLIYLPFYLIDRKKNLIK